MDDKSDLERLENKLDIIMNYCLEIENKKIDKSNEKLKKEKRKEHRRYINTILKSLPNLEIYAELKDLSKADLENMTDNYFQAVLMGTKNTNELKKYSINKEDIQKRIRTKIHVDRIHNILDSYLDQIDEYKSNDILKAKKTILRRLYGYRLQEGEKKSKSREQLAEELFIAPRTIYKYQEELLDDLAPAFFGVDGLVL